MPLVFKAKFSCGKLFLQLFRVSQRDLSDLGVSAVNVRLEYSHR